MCVLLTEKEPIEENVLATKKTKKKGGTLGIAPKTSRTQTENHTTRPYALLLKVLIKTASYPLAKKKRNKHFSPKKKTQPIFVHPPNHRPAF